MKSKLTRWLVIPVFSVMPFCGQAIAAEKEGNPTYTNPAYGISMNLPEISAESRADITLAVFNVSVGVSHVGNINIGVHLAAITREECLQHVLAAIASQKQELDSKELLEVDGHDAFTIESHGRVEGQDLHFLALYIIEKAQEIVVTCTASEEKYKIAYPQFQAAIQGVKLAVSGGEKKDKPTYGNPAYGISMGLPETSIKEGAAALLALFYASVPGGSINIEAHSTATTREEFMRRALATIASEKQELDSKELLQVDGRDAFMIESHGHIEGSDFHFLALFIIDKAQTITVICTAPEEKYKIAYPQFQAALNSVKLEHATRSPTNP